MYKFIIHSIRSHRYLLEKSLPILGLPWSNCGIISLKFLEVLLSIIWQRGFAKYAHKILWRISVCLKRSLRHNLRFRGNPKKGFYSHTLSFTFTLRPHSQHPGFDLFPEVFYFFETPLLVRKTFLIPLGFLQKSTQKLNCLFFGLSLSSHIFLQAATSQGAPLGLYPEIFPATSPG